MKKQIALFISIVMIISLSACGESNSASTQVSNSKSNNQTEVNSEEAAPEAEEATSAVAEYDHPSDFVVCEGDSIYFTPITDDYVIGSSNEEAIYANTELVCFDDKGKDVYDVYRTLYSTEQEAKDSINSQGNITVVTSKEEFKENTVAVVGNAVYQCLPLSQRENASLNDSSKMRFFYLAEDDSSSQMKYWFSTTGFTEEQIVIENYCAPEDFIGASHFEPDTKDYLLTEYDCDDYKQTTLYAYDETGKCMQCVLYYQYASEEIAKQYVEGNEDFVRYEDGIYCYTEQKDRIDVVCSSKEKEYFEFEQHKDKSEVDYSMSQNKKYFSIPSLTEVQKPEYLKQMAGITW